MGKIYFNKNWVFIEKKDRIYLYNFVLSKELFINKDKEESLFLLRKFSENIHEKSIQDTSSDFKEMFPNKDMKWFDNSIRQLKKYGIIKNVVQKPKQLTQRYLLGLDRQIDYLEDLFPDENKYKIQEKIKNTKVAILGLGSVAQNIIQCLVSSGIGNYVCVDFDVVEKRNMGRQPLFRNSDIGKSKTSVVKKYIEESRYGNKVRAVKKMLSGVRDVENVIFDCDIVLHCCDYPRFIIHQWINEACLKHHKPNLLVHSGRVGPFSIPYKTSCYGCLEAFYETHFRGYADIRKTIIDSGFGRYPDLSIVSSLTGVLAAKEVIAFILGLKYDTNNAFLDIKPQTLEVVKHKLEKHKGCHICHESKK